MQALTVQRYADLAGNSGVAAFEIGDDYIRVQFRGGPVYRYTHVRPGRFDVESMKRLARRGRGLTTYINQHVRNRYADKEG